MILVSVLSSLSVGYGRIKVEQAHKQYDIAVRYTDILEISMQTGISYEDTLKQLKNSGANILFVPENKVARGEIDSLASFMAQGTATYYSGYDLMTDENQEIHPQYTYIWSCDDYTTRNIMEYFTYKGYIINQVIINERTYLELPYPKSLLFTVGVGFNEGDLLKAAELGFQICPQVLSLTTDSDQGIDYMVKRISELPNLGPIFFSDPNVECYQNDEMAQLLKEHGMGFVEFFSNKQEGFKVLARDASDSFKNCNIYRLHTLADGEVDRYTEGALYDRFELALTERGISYFLFKAPKKHLPIDNFNELKERIKGFNEIAEKQGYVQGNINPLNFRPIGYIRTFLAGLVGIGIFVLLCMELKRTNLGIFLGTIGVLGYAVLLLFSMRLGTQLMALFITVCFPTYAMFIGLKCKKGSIPDLVKGVGIVFSICLLGAISFVGMMSRTEYGLGIELFRGIKIAFALPLVCIGLLLMYRERLLRMEVLEKWIKMPITYLVAVVLGIFMITFGIYILRSGNTSSVSSIQLQLRQLLKDILGVRPRTKEFLIGYPIIMCLIYFGKHKLYIPFSLLAMVGPVSIVNTFTHLHTPLLISIQRTIIGLVVGVIIGCIMIIVIESGMSLFNKWNKVYKEEHI